MGSQPPTVLLLPGTACTGRLWQAQREELLALGHRVAVAVPDAPTLTGMAEAALGAADGPLVLVGHSLGGIVAMAAARLAPGRVGGLALLSTTARPPRPEQRRAWTDWTARAMAGGLADVVRETLHPLMVHPTRRDDPHLRELVAAMAAETGPAAFARQLAAQQTRVDERPGLAAWARLRRPTLVLAAADDALCPVALHEEIADLVPGAELGVVERSGHLSPLERAAEVTRALAAWLPPPAAPPDPFTRAAALEET